MNVMATVDPNAHDRFVRRLILANAVGMDALQAR